MIYLMQFFTIGASAELSNDDEIKLGDAVHPRFRIMNTIMCGMCETVFKPVVNSISQNSPIVSFEIKT